MTAGFPCPAAQCLREPFFKRGRGEGERNMVGDIGFQAINQDDNILLNI